MLGKNYAKHDLEKILDACPDLAWIINEAEQFVYVNKTFLGTFRKNKEEVIGEKEVHVCGGTLSGGELMIEGIKHYFEVNEREIIENGSLVGRLGVATNVTMEQRLNTIVDTCIMEKLTKIQQHTEQEDLLAVKKALAIWEKYLFSSMPPIGKIIFLYNQRDEYLEIGLNEGECKGWKELDELNLVRQYIAQDMKACDPKSQIVRRVEALPDSVYKQMLQDKNIDMILECGIPFGDELVGMIAFYFNKSQPIQVAGTKGYMRQVAKNLGILIKNMLISGQVTKQIKESKSVAKQFQSFLELTTDYIGVVESETMAVRSLSSNWNDELRRKMLAYQIESKKVLCEAFDRAKTSQKVVTEELHYQWGEEEVRTILWEIRYMNVENYFLVWGQNITARKLFEAQKLELQSKMEKEKVTSEMLKHMTYTFEEPIRKIESSIETIEALGDKKYNAYTQMMRVNTGRLHRLKENLLKSNKGQYQEDQLNRVVCDLVHLLRELVGGMEAYVETNQKQIRFIADTGVLIYCLDVEKFENIIINLISNALKYTQADDEIIVYLASDEYHINIHVMDNGEGIPKARLPYIFERFNQGEALVHTKKEGSGIGLSTVKRWVALHGGTVYVASEWGSGSEFIISLPQVIGETIEDGPLANHFSEFYKTSYGERK